MADARETPKVVVVMPAYNAGRTLRLTYEELPKDTVNLEILVDDDKMFLEAQTFMHICPVEATAVDGLVGICGDKDAVRLIAKAHQQPQRAGVKVLRFINHHCVIGETHYTFCRAFLCHSSRLSPGLFALLFQESLKSLVYPPDRLPLECVETDFATWTRCCQVLL